MAGYRLNKEKRTLIRISVALASRDPGFLREVLEDGARLGNPRRVEEVLLQSYLFLGYPIALNAFALWREISGRGPGRGSRDDWEGWRSRGEHVCRVVYGGQYDGLRRNVRALHPDMERWMVVEGYGKVLGRTSLDLPTRELCIVALLVVLGAPRQLYSHLRGALNTLVRPAVVEETLELACDRLGESEAAEARVVWEKVQARALDGASSATLESP
jgi:4-carboxymuconolactone decarboxylase